VAEDVVEGGAELREVALKLTAAGQVELRRAMYRNIRIATLPARPAIRTSAMEMLPRSGGLNAWVAKATTRTSILTGTRTAGVVVRVTKKGHVMKDIDAGNVRHPVYGNRDAWVGQSVPAGFASTPMKALAPAVGAACLVAMRETAAAAGFH